jgi:hypothetical protein
MELSNYEIVRYPSGQITITRITKGSTARDVVGAYTNEADAQRALARLTAADAPSGDAIAAGTPLLHRAA